MATERLRGPIKQNLESLRIRMWGVLEPFAQMGMHKREICAAVAITTREQLPTTSVTNTLKWAIERRRLPSLTDEEKQSVKNDQYAKDEEVEDRVFKWLVAKEILVKRGSRMSQGRIEWLKVIEAMGDMDESLSIVKSLLGRGGSISEATLIAKLNLQSTEDKIVNFAQGLVEGGMISRENLLDHRELKNILQKHNIELSSFAISIVLEAFIAARRGIANKDMSLISKYNELREQFLDQESQGSLDLEQLEDIIGGIEINQNPYYGVDHLGSYRLDGDGNRVRRPICIGDNGKMVYDNPDFGIQRQYSRNRVEVDKIEEDIRKEKNRLQRRVTPLWEIEHPLDAKH